MLHIKKNDTVQVITGKDKGKKGKVLKVLPADEKIVVEGVNVITKHVRARKSGEQGQKVFYPGRLHLSKVMVVCPQCGKATRVGMAVSEDAHAKKNRVCKKCNQVFGA